MERVAKIADENISWIAGCGHAGDGNVHLSVFQPDDELRYKVLSELFALGMELGVPSRASTVSAPLSAAGI